MLELETCLCEIRVAGNGNSFISSCGLELSLKPTYIENLRWASSFSKEPAQRTRATGKYDCIKHYGNPTDFTKISLLNKMQRDLQIVLCTSEIIIYYFQSPSKVLSPNKKQDFCSSAMPLMEACSLSMTLEMSSCKNIPSSYFAL